MQLCNTGRTPAIWLAGQILSSANVGSVLSKHCNVKADIRGFRCTELTISIVSIGESHIGQACVSAAAHCLQQACKHGSNRAYCAIGVSQITHKLIESLVLPVLITLPCFEITTDGSVIEKNLRLAVCRRADVVSQVSTLYVGFLERRYVHRHVRKPWMHLSTPKLSRSHTAHLYVGSCCIHELTWRQAQLSRKRHVHAVGQLDTSVSTNA